MIDMTETDYFTCSRLHHGSRCTLLGYIHFGRSTSAARIADFNPTYAAAPRPISTRDFNHPRFGISQLYIIIFILLRDLINRLHVCTRLKMVVARKLN